jgi:hypothetical protein
MYGPVNLGPAVFAQPCGFVWLSPPTSATIAGDSLSCPDLCSRAGPLRALLHSLVTTWVDHDLGYDKSSSFPAAGSLDHELMIAPAYHDLRLMTGRMTSVLLVTAAGPALVLHYIACIHRDSAAAAGNRNARRAIPDTRAWRGLPQRPINSEYVKACGRFARVGWLCVIHGRRRQDYRDYDTVTRDVHKVWVNKASISPENNWMNLP